MTTPDLTPQQKQLVAELVTDGLAIQHKFKPEPLYRQTGKGHYQSDLVDEVRKARGLSKGEKKSS